MLAETHQEYCRDVVLYGSGFGPGKAKFEYSNLREGNEIVIPDDTSESMLPRVISTCMKIGF